MSANRPPWRSVDRILERRPAIGGLAVVILFFIVAATAQLISPYDSNATNTISISD